ncbi:MAG: hypothetical protein CVU17_06860 [Betaproteobacteria bacterium HGW-Betaproteobacteria-11]|nr:MAG: hypothetical protein CVU17_06860 [Betaproteobacteria bacterium HGW-Betaproteobacteria-11]
MNRAQRLALLVAAVNLALALAFPPHDYFSLQRGNIPTFDGFYFALRQAPNRVVNADFLTLEIIVILINAAIAWLLLRNTPARARKLPGGNRLQRRILVLIALNLIVILLFPPFENFASISKAVLPSFEGFYFVFGDNSQRQLVASILYIEVTLVLINGGLLWLLFKDKSREELNAEQVRALAARVRAAQRE